MKEGRFAHSCGKASGVFALMLAACIACAACGRKTPDTAAVPKEPEKPAVTGEAAVKEPEVPETVLGLTGTPIHLSYTQQYETVQQYETNDQLLIDACADALYHVEVGNETDVRTTDSDEVLTFTSEDGTDETLRFQNGNLCYDGRVYEVTGYEAVKEALQKVVDAVEAEREAQFLQGYGLQEIPAGYEIYKNAAADYSFLYTHRFTSEEMEDQAGTIFYTDPERINYFCVFADSSSGLSTDDYLNRVGEHFKEAAAQNGYEIWLEPAAAEPLTLNGRTLQGIHYGYTVEGSRREYTDYIETVSDGREQNIILYEQHVAAGSDNTTSLALQDAVASFVPRAGFYEAVPEEEPVQNVTVLTAEIASPEFHIGEDEVVFINDVQDFSVILPSFSAAGIVQGSGSMLVYCSGNSDFPVVEISRYEGGPDAETYLQQSLEQLSEDENASGLPDAIEAFGVNGGEAYCFSYYLRDAEGSTSGKTLTAVNIDGGIAVFDATYYDTGMHDLNRVLSRATESFRESAGAYTG